MDARPPDVARPDRLTNFPAVSCGDLRVPAPYNRFVGPAVRRQTYTDSDPKEGHGIAASTGCDS